MSKKARKWNQLLLFAGILSCILMLRIEFSKATDFNDFMWGMSEDEIISQFGDPAEKNVQEQSVTLVYDTPIATEFGVSSYTSFFVVTDPDFSGDQELGLCSFSVHVDEIEESELLATLEAYVPGGEYEHSEQMELYFKKSLPDYVYMHSISSSDLLGAYFEENAEKESTYEEISGYVPVTKTIEDDCPVTDALYYGEKNEESIQNCTITIDGTIKNMVTSIMEKTSN
jgi:hypothetical protein